MIISIIKQDNHNFFIKPNFYFFYCKIEIQHDKQNIVTVLQLFIINLRKNELFY